MTCDIQPGAGRYWRHGFGSWNYKISTLILLSLPRYWNASTAGDSLVLSPKGERNGGWQVRNYESLEGARGSLILLYISPSPCSTLSSQPCFNTKTWLSLARRWRQLFPSQVHMPCPLHMFTQRTVTSDQSSFSRTIPGIYKAIFLWDPELPLFPQYRRRFRRVSFKFRFACIIACSRQK